MWCCRLVITAWGANECVWYIIVDPDNADLEIYLRLTPSFGFVPNNGIGQNYGAQFQATWGFMGTRTVALS